MKRIIASLLSGEHHRLPHRRVVVLVIALTLATVTALAWKVIDDRQKELAMVRSEQQLQSQTLGNVMETSFDAVEHVMTGLASPLESGGGSVATRLDLRGALLRSPALLDLAFYGPDERLVAHGSLTPPPDPVLPQWVSKEAGGGRATGIGRIGAELAIFRTLRGSLGQLAGTVVATFSKDYFQGVAAQIPGSVPKASFLLGPDNRRLLEFSDSGEREQFDSIVRLLDQEAVFGPQGSRFLESGDSLIVTQQLRIHPIQLVQVVSRDLSLARWHAEVLQSAVLAAAVVLVALLFLLHWLRSVHEQQRLLSDLHLMQLAMEQTPASLVITDLQASIQYVNPRFTEVTGYSADEIRGRNPRVLHSGTTPGPVYAAFWHALTHGLVWHGELLNRRKNGETYWEETHVAPVKNLAGAVTHYVAVKVDISERKRVEAALQSSEAFSRSILNSVPDHIAVIDRAGVIVAVNEHWRKFASDNAGQAHVIETGTGVGANYLMACTATGGGLDAYAGIVAVLEGRQGSFSLEYPCHSTHEQRWFLMTVTPMGQSGGDGAVITHANITARKKAEESVLELNRNFVSFLENSSDFIYFKDANSRFRFCSQTLANITGHASWRDMVGKHDSEVFPPDTARIYQEEEVPIFRDGTALLNKVDPFVDANGQAGWVSTSKWPLRDQNGQVTGLFGISRDITGQQGAQAKIKLAANVFTHAREGIAITDAQGAIIDVNNAFSRITGYALAEVLGKNPSLLQSGRQGQPFYEAMWRDILDKGYWSGEIWNRRKSGEVYAELLTISAVRDDLGQPQQFVAMFSDITPLKEHEQQLERIAHFDALTGLPNRVLLADRLHQAMAQAQRRGTRLAVAFLDLDGFKAINDRHGHAGGDQLLIGLSGRMKSSLREGDTLARLGGDEFVAVLGDLEDVSAGLPTLLRLLAAAAEPVRFGELELKVSASLGVTFYPQPEEIDADTLLRQADLAMYQAKLGGKNRYHVFDSDQDRSVRGHHEDLEGIRQGLLEHQFALHYQPKVNMRTGAVVGAEALIRWLHPQSGLLAPAAFLPTIEEHPLAIEVGEWVIDSALTQMERWQAQGLDIPVSVNVGATQLQQPVFAQRLQQILQSHPDILPSSLELEVLETSALQDIDGVSRVMEACRAMGVHFALDDFGTGYSSLTYLKRLPVALLKIDQSFVRHMLDDPDDLAILEGVIGMASAFHREIIAEGVETVEHGVLLLQLGCELAQGFGIARPMPADDIPQWVANWRPDPAWRQLGKVSRDDLPLLFAGVELRAWVLACEAALKRNVGSWVPPDLHDSRFCVWLQGSGLSAHGGQPAYTSLCSLYREISSLGAELLSLQAAGDGDQALARLGELQALRDAALQQLELARRGWKSQLQMALSD